MKKLVSLAMSLLVAALLCFFTAARAQEPAASLPDQSDASKRVMVLKGGNLAMIAQACGHRQTDWTALLAANPNLPKPTKAGLMWGVLVFPEQILNLPRGWSYGTLDPEYVVPVSNPKEVRETEVRETIAQKIDRGLLEDQKTSAFKVGHPEKELIWGMPQWLFGVLAAVLLVIIVIWIMILRIWLGDPNRYPAMIPGGLSADLATAARQIEATYSGRQIRNLERARLVRDSGVPRILVGMTFADGRERQVYLNQGDEVYREVLPGGGYEEYYRQSCGNLASRFVLPVGWRVIRLSETWQASQPVATSAGAGASTSSATATQTPQAATTTTTAATTAAAETTTTAEVEPAEAATATPVDEKVSADEKTAEEPPAAENTPTPKKVKVAIDGVTIEVTGNGKIPGTKVELEDGTTVLLQ